jgi:hypothetical protein
MKPRKDTSHERNFVIFPEKKGEILIKRQLHIACLQMNGATLSTCSDCIYFSFRFCCYYYLIIPFFLFYISSRVIINKVLFRTAICFVVLFNKLKLD